DHPGSAGSRSVRFYASCREEPTRSGGARLIAQRIHFLEFAREAVMARRASSKTVMEDRVRAAHPQVVTLFIKPQTPDRFAKVRKLRGYEEGMAPGST